MSDANTEVSDLISSCDGNIVAVAAFAVKMVGLLDQFRTESVKAERALRAENERLRDALEYYASPSIYADRGGSPEIESDLGENARDALQDAAK